MAASIWEPERPSDVAAGAALARMPSVGSSRTPDVSVVIPAYNEARRIVPTLNSRCEYFSALGLSHEILVVDDGSRDTTAAVVRDVSKQLEPVRLIRLPSNLGKGAAIRTGVRNASGRLVLLDDADGATPIGEFLRLRSALEAGADIAIGSRAFPGDESRVERRFKRWIMGRVFAFVVNRWAVPGIADTQCGFKLFHGAAARRVFALQRLNGFAFDVEALRLAHALEYRVVEVPIHWADVPGSKVNLTVDSVRMLWDVLCTPLLVQRALKGGVPLLSELDPEPLKIGGGR